MPVSHEPRGTLCVIRKNYVLYKVAYFYHGILCMKQPLAYGVGNNEPTFLICSKDKCNYIITSDYIGWTGDYCLLKVQL